MKNNKKKFYDTIANEFSNLKNIYDTTRRKEILIDIYLKQVINKNKSILDCGTADGYFTSEILKMNNSLIVEACDISKELLKIAKKNNNNKNIFFEHDINEKRTPRKYDIVLSSEVIEHCQNPIRALNNLCDSINKNGYLILSTPNKYWLPIVKLANFLKLRPFEGYENFLSKNKIIKILKKNKFELIYFHGIHLFPFQFGFNSFHRYLDSNSKFLDNFKINHTFLAKKIRDN